ncbi:MAG: ABC transporter ATP-binding protein [Clostridiales bacterium]|nr:ABC transporter ATP-binding protein [Clostridiales bacterium]
MLMEARDVTKFFPVSQGVLPGNKQRSWLHAVDHVDLAIREGEIYGIVRESGSGKSTLGRCVLQLLSIDSGEVYFQGKRIDNLDKQGIRELRRKMQMVFQNPLASFNPKQYIGSALHEVCQYYKMPKAEMNRRIVEILQLINLPADVLNRMPGQLSGGQLQRLAIARCLLLDPEFLVADEPVSALDVSVQAQILNLLLDLRDRLGLTMMFISHDLSVVERVCDQVAVLYLGAVMEKAPKHELFYHTAHPYTKALMEVNPVNHPSKRRDKVILAGNIPSAVDVGEGCRFSQRCSYCEKGVCDCVTPPLKEVEPGHFVACHKPLWDGA